MRTSEDETFQFIKYVVSWIYDENRGGWNYRLRDEDNNVYDHLVKETDMQRA